MLSVVIQNANILNVANNPFMLSFVVLNVIMLNVIMLNVIMLNVIMLNDIMLNDIMLNVIVLNVIMLNAIMLSVVMLNVIMLFAQSAKGSTGSVIIEIELHIQRDGEHAVPGHCMHYIICHRFNIS